MIIPKGTIPPQIHGLNYGYFPSRVMKAMLCHQTGTERDTFEWLDFQRNVTCIVSHPDIEIPYFFEGKTHLYHPDIFYIANSKCYLCECKAGKYLHTPKNLAKYEGAKIWCEPQNCVFEVVSSTEIEASYKLANIRFMRRYSRYRVNTKIQWHIEEALKIAKVPLTVFAIASAVTPKNPKEIVPLIYCLLYHHYLFTDIENIPVSIDSLVYLPQMAGRPDYA